jgi:translation initiation factor 3 subunit M
LASDSRYYVFLAILKVIKATNSSISFEALTPQLETNIPLWLSAWQLDDEDARNLYVSIADVAITTGNESLSYKYLLHALETIPPDTASEEASIDLAKRTLRAALINPAVTDFTPLTASDAIQAIRKSDSNLFDLLEIFSSDDYTSYTDFLETNDLSSLGISEDQAQVLSTKIRLLTLATIAASSQTRSVPYSSIATALQIPSDDVEMWVIDTIRAGLIEGKLSQLKQELLVQRATYRVFGEKQWAEIQGRLMVWRRTLESVLQAVKTEREKFAREGMGPVDSAVNGYYGNDADGHHQQRGGGGGDNRQRRGGGGRGRGGHHRDQQRDQQMSREVEVGGGD